MYRLLKSCGRAKRACLETAHGIIQTPIFMNVGTQAAIKGGVSSADLTGIKCGVLLSNAYHLHVRPGDQLIKELGGLHKFLSWDGPILTDSGGFQILSLSSLVKIKEEGCFFASHIDGKKIFMGPEESMEAQSNLASDVAMAFDECAPHDAGREYIRESADRTSRWLERCAAKLGELALNENTLNKKQLLFGIAQGGVYADIRRSHAKTVSSMDLDGYAIGGLAVGEPAEVMYEMLDETIPLLPREKPTYLMGVGTPANILEAVGRGVDFFDCVLPARNGRHANVYTGSGRLNLLNAKYERDPRPIEPDCACPACAKYTRAYIRHLFKAGELLALRLCVLHNLYFYNNLMEEIRDALDGGVYESFAKEKLSIWSQGQTRAE